MNNLWKVVLCSLPLLIATGCSIRGGGVAPAAVPVVTVEAVMESVAEGTPLVFTIRVVPPAKADLSVNLTWEEPASLLASPPRTVTVAAGRGEITLTVDTGEGAVAELAGTVTVMIAAGTGYRGGSVAGTASVTVTAASDDEKPATETPATETPATETPPRETPPRETPPRETPPRETPPRETPPRETPPRETPPRETPPRETPPRETPPRETPPRETPPRETPPRETPPRETPPPEPQTRRPVVTVAAVVTTIPTKEGGSGWFKVTATPAPATALTVNVAWEETGDMLAPERPSSVIVVTGGTANLWVPTIDDATEESDSRVTAILGDGPGYAIGMNARATRIVLDNDRTVHMESVEPSPVREGETLRITIALSRPASIFFCFSVEAADSATGDDRISQCVYESDSTATLHHTVGNDGTVTSERTVTVKVKHVLTEVYSRGTPHEVTVPVIDAGS